jgi:hypothetical protein
MAYPFPLPAQNSANYRQINFVPAKILPASQINALESQLDSKREMGFMKLVPEGAVINATLSYNSGNVVFSRTNASIPMGICIQGRFEELPATTISFDPAKTSGTDSIFLNWVLYRVTANSSGTINDGTLLDITTGETTAEWGQLWFEISSVDRSTQTTGVGPDGVAVFSMNATPIEVFSFTRGAGGSFTPIASKRLSPLFFADSFNPGVVKLSYGSSGVACATDDPRLAPAPEAGPITVATKDVVTPVALTPTQTNSFGAEKYDVLQNTSGILSTWILDFGHACNLTDTLNYLVTSIAALQGQVGALQATSHSTSTSTAAPQIPSNHVGQPLGLANTHPAALTSGTGGFVVNQTYDATPSPTKYGFSIKNNAGSTIVGLTHDGDVYSDKVAGILKDSGGNPVSLLSQMATIVQGLEDAQGTSVAGSATESFVTSAVATALASANAYTDSHTPAAAVSQTLETDGAITYSIVSSGNLKLAFGSGVVPNGTTIPAPAGFSASNGFILPSMSRDNEVEANIVSTKCYASGLTVFSQKTRNDGTIAQCDANVMAIFWKISS